MSQPYYYSVYGGPPSPRTGARHASISPYGPDPARGGQVFLGIQNEREWAVLDERILGRPDLVTDERFATNPARVAHHDELTAILTGVFAGIGVDQLEAALEAAGIANARMRDPGEFAAHPQLAARDLVARRGLPGRAGPAAAAGDSARPDRRDGRGPGARAAHDSHPRGIRTPTAGGITMTTTQASPTAQLPHFSLVIDGQLTEPVSGRSYDSVDPFSGAPWATAADGGEADVNLAVAAARRALAGPWGQLTGFGRARLMWRLAELIARDADRLAEFETRDTGKLLREIRGQLGSIPDWFYYFSGLADKLEGSTIPADKPNFLVYTRREPAGVVAAIVPWNSPLLLLCWKLAPALAAGCTMVAKPSDYSRRPRSRWPAWSRRPVSRPACSTWSAGSGRRWARRWPGTPAWTRSSSPDPPRSGPKSPRPRPPTSPGCCSSWAASPRTWSSPTPTSTRPAMGWWPGCSRRPARPAWPGPGCWCTGACTTRS